MDRNNLKTEITKMRNGQYDYECHMIWQQAVHTPPNYHLKWSDLH